MHSNSKVIIYAIFIRHRFKNYSFVPYISLTGDGVYTSIDLSYNKNLARFNANVFKPVLQKMKTAAEAIPRVVNVGPMGISVYLTKIKIFATRNFLTSHIHLYMSCYI